MPVITMECTSLKPEQKKELIKSFTQTAAEITGIPKQAFTVLIHEQPTENIGVGGEALSDIKQQIKNAGKK